MKIFNSRICRDETFCCSEKVIKNNLNNIFDDECFIHFGCFEKKYIAKYYGDRRLNKAIQGIIVARFCVANDAYYQRQKPLVGARCNLTLFAVQQELISQDLRNSFEKYILPQFVDLYKNSFIFQDSPVYKNIVLVELSNNAFILHALQRFA